MVKVADPTQLRVEDVVAWPARNRILINHHHHHHHYQQQQQNYRHRQNYYHHRCHQHQQNHYCHHHLQTCYLLHVQHEEQQCQSQKNAHVKTMKLRRKFRKSEERDTREIRQGNT